MEEFVVVTTTTAKREDANRIARTLIEARLAACVQVLGPITSVYRWKGKIETEEEWLCLVKSSRSCYGALEETILAIHPYETPEIVATAIAAGSRGYLGWLGDQLTEAGGG